MPDREPEPILTVAQLAQRWGKAPHTLANWRAAGLGPAYFKAGRTVLYKVKAVEAYEERHSVRPRAGGSP